MAEKSKRITFAVTADMIPIMDEAKRMFYNQNRSDMIRILLLVGLDEAERRADNEKNIKCGKTA